MGAASLDALRGRPRSAAFLLFQGAGWKGFWDTMASPLRASQMPDSPVPDTGRHDDTVASYAAIDIRAELASRPYRPPNYEAEDRALAVLAAELAENPRNMLQKLAEMALDLCDADSAGISLLETRDGVEVFRWEALAGIFSAFRNQTILRNASPCGVCIDQNTTQLLYLPDRYFAASRVDPRVVEALLIPFHYQGRPVGTVWIVTHRLDRKFDRENERLVRTLAAFVSAGWQLWQAQEQLANLPALLVQAQETERRLFASELHDDLSQKLIALSMQVSALSKPSGESPDVTGQRIHDLGQKIGKLADDVHRMSHQLHPAILDDLGLEVALRDECTSFSQRRNIPVQFEAKDVPRSLPGDIALCLFRVAQESLRNIAKHAKAKDVRVRLARRKTGLALFIEDSGDGFDVEQATGKGGLGLISMQERVRLVHGAFKIRSRAGVGTKIEVYVPISEKSS